MTDEEDNIFTWNDIVKIKDIAGIKTCLYFRECMFISVLFVDEQYRGKGLGSWLLQYAENKAKSRGIKLVHLDTFDFQAKNFYFKNGYPKFAGFPEEPCKFFTTS